MSTLKVNKLRDTAGSADAITLDPNGGVVLAGVTTVSTVKVGSGVTISSDGDIFHTGVCTATSFSGEIPAASIVGVCTSGLTKTGGFGGITMATQWRVTADFTIGTGDGNYTIASNWETADTLGFARIGSDLTESSGVFTFPSTGIYRIFAHTVCNNTSSASYRAQLAIHVTTDNSSYDTAAVGKHSFSSPAEQSGGMNCEYLFDVTSTSTHKFKIVVRSYQDNIKFQGDTDKPQTSINVFRLGDT